MTKVQQAAIKLSHRTYGQDAYYDPDKMITIPEALHLLLLYHLDFGGNATVSKDPVTADGQIIAESMTGWWRTDRHTFTGADNDIAPLCRAINFFLSCREDTRPALREIERLISPLGTNINHTAFRKIGEAFITRSGQACLAMLLACGVTDQFDLARGITYFQTMNSKENEVRYGTHNVTALLELLLEFPHMCLNDLMDAVGV